MHQQYYQIQVIDQTLWVTANGSSKLSVVQAYIKDFRFAASRLSSQPWACVLDLRLWQPSPHETVALLQDNTRWCFDHGLQLGLAIIPDDPVAVWQHLKATSAQSPANVERYQVKTIEEAQAILRQRGFLAPTTG